VRAFGVVGIVLAGAAAALWYVAGQTSGAASWLSLAGLALAGLSAAACFGAAFVIQFHKLVGAVLFRAAGLILVGGLIGICLVAWAPALLYAQVDALAARHNPGGLSLTVAEIVAGLGDDWAGAQVYAYLLWPLQFRLTRDILGAVGVIGFVSLLAMFAIWWERKLAGRMQSRLGPMRVGGWHGWAQSMADGLKLIQKEDIFLEGADRTLFHLSAYVVFIPALAIFLALPFSAAWICRDLDIGLIFIFAMIGLGVIGVLLAGWASNNKWSMYGAMREACQMVSYEIPLGFSLLVPVLTAGTLRLTTIGELQSGGFHTWLAFSSPFTFAGARLFFTATLASCKRAPFDLPEAESELVAGFLTEFSGFRWCLFFFAEYAEMFAVGALAAILFLGGWHSPLPAVWGAAWEDGLLWQRVLHGVLYSGPLWLIFKGVGVVFVQMWLRWTLPRIRLDQVMYACVQVLLPLSMLVLLAQTLWQLWVPAGSGLAVMANFVCAALGALAVVAVPAIAVYGYTHRRRLVGTLVIDHLPGS
jgi:NADH-quinone oxidoreductase subunit H